MKTGFYVVLAAVTTFFVVWGIAALARHLTGVPRNFPPFTALPLLSGVVGGFCGAAAVYAIVRASSTNPDRAFLFVAITFLALSFALPIRLSFTKSRRFAGVTPSAQMTLALLHTIIATSSVTALTRWEKAGDSPRCQPNPPSSRAFLYGSSGF